MIHFSTLLLGSHLFGAGVSLLLVIGAIVSLIRQSAHHYLFLLRSLGLAAAFQLLTGIGLVLSLYNQTSVLTLCVRVGLYILVVCGVQAVLLHRLKQTEHVHAQS